METKRFNSFTGIYYRKIQIYMKRAFKLLGVSFDEGIVLQNVLLNPGTTQDRIAETLVLDAAAVARSLKSLEGKGLLTRVVDAGNQRRKLVTITPDGEQMAQQINTAMNAWDNEIFQNTTNEDAARIVESARFLHHRATDIDISSVLKNAFPSG